MLAFFLASFSVGSGSFMSAPRLVAACRSPSSNFSPRNFSGFTHLPSHFIHANLSGDSTRPLSFSFTIMSVIPSSSGLSPATTPSSRYRTPSVFSDSKSLNIMFVMNGLNAQPCGIPKPTSSFLSISRSKSHMLFGCVRYFSGRLSIIRWLDLMCGGISSSVYWYPFPDTYPVSANIGSNGAIGFSNHFAWAFIMSLHLSSFSFSFSLSLWIIHAFSSATGLCHQGISCLYMSYMNAVFAFATFAHSSALSSSLTLLCAYVNTPIMKLCMHGGHFRSSSRYWTNFHEIPSKHFAMSNSAMYFLSFIFRKISFHALPADLLAIPPNCFGEYTSGPYHISVMNSIHFDTILHGSVGTASGLSVPFAFSIHILWYLNFHDPTCSIFCRSIHKVSCWSLLNFSHHPLFASIIIFNLNIFECLDRIIVRLWNLRTSHCSAALLSCSTDLRIYLLIRIRSCSVAAVVSSLLISFSGVSFSVILSAAIAINFHCTLAGLIMIFVTLIPDFVQSSPSWLKVRLNFCIMSLLQFLSISFYLNLIRGWASALT